LRGAAAIKGRLDMLKYNFGCGNFRKPGFVNVDVRDDSAADVVTEAWRLDMFPQATADLVYSRHMLEHLDPQDARRTLRGWCQLLRPGGELNVIVPDITFHARQLLGLAKGPFANQVDHALAGFWGWRDEARGGNREDTHRWGYTEQSLCGELALAGFENISRVMAGQDSEAWHLNLTCKRPSAAMSEIAG
jgi:SAM-dependent methyltransferase